MSYEKFLDTCEIDLKNNSKLFKLKYYEKIENTQYDIKDLKASISKTYDIYDTSLIYKLYKNNAIKIQNFLNKIVFYTNINNPRIIDQKIFESIDDSNIFLNTIYYDGNITIKNRINKNKIYFIEKIVIDNKHIIQIGNNITIDDIMNDIKDYYIKLFNLNEHKYSNILDIINHLYYYVNTIDINDFTFFYDNIEFIYNFDLENGKTLLKEMIKYDMNIDEKTLDYPRIKFDVLNGYENMININNNMAEVYKYENKEYNLTMIQNNKSNEFIITNEIDNKKYFLYEKKYYLLNKENLELFHKSNYLKFNDKYVKYKINDNFINRIKNFYESKKFKFPSSITDNIDIIENEDNNIDIKNYLKNDIMILLDNDVKELNDFISKYFFIKNNFIWSKKYNIKVICSHIINNNIIENNKCNVCGEIISYQFIDPVKYEGDTKVTQIDRFETSSEDIYIEEYVFKLFTDQNLYDIYYDYKSLFYDSKINNLLIKYSKNNINEIKKNAENDTDNSNNEINHSTYLIFKIYESLEILFDSKFKIKNKKLQSKYDKIKKYDDALQNDKNLNVCKNSIIDYYKSLKSKIFIQSNSYNFSDESKISIKTIDCEKFDEISKIYEFTYLNENYLDKLDNSFNIKYNDIKIHTHTGKESNIKIPHNKKILEELNHYKNQKLNIEKKCNKTIDDQKININESDFDIELDVNDDNDINNIYERNIVTHLNNKLDELKHVIILISMKKKNDIKNVIFNDLNEVNIDNHKLLFKFNNFTDKKQILHCIEKTFEALFHGDKNKFDLFININEFIFYTKEEINNLKRKYYLSKKPAVNVTDVLKTLKIETAEKDKIDLLDNDKKEGKDQETESEYNQIYYQVEDD